MYYFEYVHIFICIYTKNTSTCSFIFTVHTCIYSTYYIYIIYIILLYINIEDRTVQYDREFRQKSLRSIKNNTVLTHIIRL